MVYPHIPPPPIFLFWGIPFTAPINLPKNLFTTPINSNEQLLIWSIFQYLCSSLLYCLSCEINWSIEFIHQLCNYKKIQYHSWPPFYSYLFLIYVIDTFLFCSLLLFENVVLLCSSNISIFRYKGVKCCCWLKEVFAFYLKLKYRCRKFLRLYWLNKLLSYFF